MWYSAGSVKTIVCSFHLNGFVLLPTEQDGYQRGQTNRVLCAWMASIATTCLAARIQTLKLSNAGTAVRRSSKRGVTNYVTEPADTLQQ